MRGNFSCEMFAKNLRKMRRKFCGQKTCEIQAKNPGSEQSSCSFFGQLYFILLYFFCHVLRRLPVSVCVCVFGPWNGRKLGEIMSCRAPGTGTRSEHRERVFILRESREKINL